MWINFCRLVRGHAWWRYAYVVAIALNILVVAFAVYDIPVESQEWSFSTSHVYRWEYSLLTIRVLGACHLFFSLCMMVNWCAGQGAMRYQALAEAYITQWYLQEKGMQTQSVIGGKRWQTERSAHKTVLSEGSLLFQPDASAWRKKKDAESVSVGTLPWRSRGRILLTLLWDPVPIYYVLWLTCDVLGLYGFTMVYCLFLFDFCVHNRTLRYVMQVWTIF